MADALARARALRADLDAYADQHERELAQTLRDAKRLEELRAPGRANTRPPSGVPPEARVAAPAPGRAQHGFWCDCRDCWTIASLISFVAWIVVLPFQGVYRVISALARRIEGGIPRDCFGYRSRIFCPRYNRDGQPEAPRGEDQLACALWFVLLCPLAYILTWSLVTRWYTPASDVTIFSHYWSSFWDWACSFVSNGFWEVLAAMTGIAFRPVLMVVIPAGVLQGFLYDLYPKMGILNWFTSISNVGLGVYSAWQKDAHDVALHVILLTHSLAVALGARSRQIVPFLFCCVRVKPHSGDETFVGDSRADEVVTGLSSSQIDRFRRGAAAALHKRVSLPATGNEFVIDPYTDEVIPGLTQGQVERDRRRKLDRFRREAAAAPNNHMSLPDLVQSAVHAWTAPDPVAAQSYGPFLSKNAGGRSVDPA